MYFEIVKSSSRHSVQFWPIFSLTLKKYLEKINYITMNLVHGTKLKKNLVIQDKVRAKLGVIIYRVKVLAALLLHDCEYKF